MDILEKKEIKEIMEKIENLTPWDKADFLDVLTDNIIDGYEFDEQTTLKERATLKERGYLNVNDTDEIEDYIKENYTDGELLDLVNSDYDVVEYVLSNGLASDVFDELDADDIVDLVSKKRHGVGDCLDELFDNYKTREEAVDWLSKRIERTFLKD